MSKDWTIRKRRPVRRKNIAPLLKELEESLQIDLSVDGAFLEMAEYGSWQMVFVDKETKQQSKKGKNQKRFRENLSRRAGAYLQILEANGRKHAILRAAHVRGPHRSGGEYGDFAHKLAGRDGELSAGVHLADQGASEQDGDVGSDAIALHHLIGIR